MMMTEERTASASETARRAMIDSQLRTSGVNEPWILTAMARVPREDFVPEAMRSSAYIDRAIALGDGRMLASPLVHGKMLAEAEPGKDDTALLIGDGNGYLAALLAPLVGSLDAIDPARAAAGDRSGPYSLVLVDGAIEEHEKLSDLLSEGGRIVMGVVDNGVTRLAKGRKIAGRVSLIPIADIGIPVLPEFNAPKGWSF